MRYQRPETFIEAKELFGWFRNRKRKKILAEPWPKGWTGILNQNVRLSRNLNAAERDLLQDRTKVFVAEKNWEGLDGLTITEEMKVTVSAQASMMLLGVSDFYFDNVKSVLLFPDAFEREFNDGTSVGAQHLAGEAWQGGPIVLSWRSVLNGCRRDSDGSNVVLHEFAHALDGLDGEMGGNIVFHEQELREAWAAVVQQGFDDLVEASSAGRRTLLDHYGATSKAEFFAVSVETFFERPTRMRQQYTRLYDLLVEYFKIDPSTWG